MPRTTKPIGISDAPPADAWAELLTALAAAKNGDFSARLVEDGHGELRMRSTFFAALVGEVIETLSQGHGQGATFRFSLPLAHVVVNEAPQEPPNASEAWRVSSGSPNA